MLAGAVRRLRHFRLSDSNGILQAKNVAFAGAELPIGPLSEAVLNVGEMCIECRVTVWVPYNEDQYSIEQFR